MVNNQLQHAKGVAYTFDAGSIDSRWSIVNSQVPRAKGVDCISDAGSNAASGALQCRRCHRPPFPPNSRRRSTLPSIERLSHAGTGRMPAMT